MAFNCIDVKRMLCMSLLWHLIGSSMAATTATVPSASELQAQVNTAIQEREKQFTIPPGSYNFSSANFNIHAASDLEVVGTGVALWFGGTFGVNVSNCENLNVSGLSINYQNPPHGHRGVPGITYNLLNSTNVFSQDITIYKAPFFSVTAFNGGGGHVFRRFVFPNDTTVGPNGKPSDLLPHQRDIFHFTDLRKGVVVEDSYGGYAGDDFFNSHNTIMIVLERVSPTSLLLINPHVQNSQIGKNTVYGTNCVLENLRQGDSMHFFAFPGEDLIPNPLSDSCVVQASPTQVINASKAADAKVLAALISQNHSTVGFDASDIWQVDFTSPLPTAVIKGSLVNLDSFSTPGTIIRNNTFMVSRYNLGRFKSNGGAIINNTFSGAGVHNLEITPLLQYFEGNLPVVRNVLVANNTMNGEGISPIHCSAFCNEKTCPYGNCTKCPLCDHDTPWTTNITVVGNNINP